MGSDTSRENRRIVEIECSTCGNEVRWLIGEETGFTRLGLAGCPGWGCGEIYQGSIIRDPDIIDTMLSKDDTIHDNTK